MRKLVEQSGKKKSKKKKPDKPNKTKPLNSKDLMAGGHSGAMKELMKPTGLRGVSDSVGASLANVSLGAGKVNFYIELILPSRSWIFNLCKCHQCF